MIYLFSIKKLETNSFFGGDYYYHNVFFYNVDLGHIYEITKKEFITPHGIITKPKYEYNKLFVDTLICDYSILHRILDDHLISKTIQKIII
jgi:hypothetical protein